MSAERHITPRVVAYLQAEHARLADPHVSFLACQVVLRQLARWARRVDPDDAGRWQSTDSIRQVAVGTGLRPRSIRYALDVLTVAGLVVTTRHGGGRGELARGSTRELILDPVDIAGTGARQSAPVNGATKAREGKNWGTDGVPLGHVRAPSVRYSVISSVSRTDPVANIDRTDPGAYDPFAARAAR